jgi:hypothetical protein
MVFLVLWEEMVLVVEIMEQQVQEHIQAVEAVEQELQEVIHHNQVLEIHHKMHRPEEKAAMDF